MAEIQSVVLSQSQSLSVSKSVSASYERNESVAALQGVLQGGVPAPSADGFGGIFDVIDISDDAREQLLQDRADAENLAAFASGERLEVLSAPLVIRNGRVEIDALAAQISEQFSFSESYALSFLQEATLDVETDEGSFSITQSRAVEVSLSAAVDILRESNANFLSTRYGV